MTLDELYLEIARRITNVVPIDFEDVWLVLIRNSTGHTSSPTWFIKSSDTGELFDGDIFGAFFCEIKAFKRENASDALNLLAKLLGEKSGKPVYCISYHLSKDGTFEVKPRYDNKWTGKDDEIPFFDDAAGFFDNWCRTNLGIEPPELNEEVQARAQALIDKKNSKQI